MKGTLCTGDFVVKRLDVLSYFDAKTFTGMFYLAVLESITSDRTRLSVYCGLDMFESLCVGDVVEVTYNNKRNVTSWKRHEATAMT